MEEEEDSPFPEVRASVSNIDDPNMPANTFRLWFLGLLVCTVAGAANTFFNFRYPAPQLSPLLILLVVYPMGKVCAAILPRRTFKMPRWLGSSQFTLNPGYFNVKEHSAIAQMANVSIVQGYAINAIVVQDSPRFYNDPRPIGFAILFALSSVCWSFGLAGFCKRFLVWPASMIWPQNLIVCTVLNTLHAEEDGQDGRMTRFKYFCLVLIGAFCWNFVPQFLFMALSTFNWVCWIAPANPYINVLFGSSGGVGMSVLTFDWNQISYIGAPMITPWWAVCNMFVGFVLLVWIVFPILYFTNTYHFGYFPIIGSSAYDRFGKPFQIRAVLEGTSLVKEAYESYSPLYISVNYYVVYWTGLALATAMIVHTALYHGGWIWNGIRGRNCESEDIHSRMMKKYKEVPGWWYLVLLVTSFAGAVVACEVYKVGLPVWGLVLSLLIPTIYILPSGFVFAMTGQVINVNLITELVSGYLLPSQPLPNMVFKAYSLAGVNSGLTFVQDLKLGHYMKVPPRVSFAAQCVGTIWLCFVQVGVKHYMFSAVPTLCTTADPHHFSCPAASVFFTSSVVWGVIGPARMFGPDTLYGSIYYALLVGAIAPIPFWYIARRFKSDNLKFISSPLILAGASYMPQVGGINYTGFFFVAFIFRELWWSCIVPNLKADTVLRIKPEFLARRYFFRWWSKYNFVTSTALDMGTAIAMLLGFFIFTLPKDGGVSLNWWGNRVQLQTMDAKHQPWLRAPADGFGPLPVSSDKASWLGKERCGILIVFPSPTEQKY